MSERWTEQDNAEFIRFWNEGLSTNEIAERYEMTAQAVRQRASLLRSRGYELADRRKS